MGVSVERGSTVTSCDPGVFFEIQLENTLQGHALETDTSLLTKFFFPRETPYIFYKTALVALVPYRTRHIFLSGSSKLSV